MFYDNPGYMSPRGAIIICIAIGLLNTLFLLNKISPISSLPTWATPVAKANQALGITTAISNATLGVSELTAGTILIMIYFADE